MNRFKTTLLTLLVALGFAMPASAQWGVGVEVGASYNYLTYDQNYFYSLYKMGGTGYSIAIPVQYGFRDWIAVRAELAVMQKNYGYELKGYFDGMYEYVRTHYIDIPVMARFSFGGKRVRGFLDAGVYAGIWAGATKEGRLEVSFTESQNLTDSIFDANDPYEFNEPYEFDSTRDNRLEAGLLAGVGIQVFINKLVSLTASCRYWYSVTDIQKQYMRNQTPKYHNTFTAQVGVMFTLPQK